ncbi:ImmA/IrrE family metallo-endopeptidase [Isobaculum melis]|uniref:IrrE N-terminal-like domain-containing protein n=1 Tax=Isobaculum melis TaxID=142588 RepID=A0A1H9TPB4_9LACT|nr:ImmA/IrrE family metallo-endopeptidase [Isobaculum melis]SER98834.1 protein of unknown function [Isobaculum melis]
MSFVDKQLTRIVKKTKTSSPLSICKKLDIPIIYLDLGNILGMKSTNKRINVIYVNINTDENKQQFIIAHELAHILLHKGIDTPFMKRVSSNSFIPKIEREANEFAIKLLTSNYSYYENCTIFQVMDDLGIPHDLHYLFNF